MTPPRVAVWGQGPSRASPSMQHQPSSAMAQGSPSTAWTPACVFSNQLVDLQALTCPPHRSPDLPQNCGAGALLPHLLPLADACSLAGRLPPNMTWLRSSCPVDHKRAYRLPKHTHSSNQEAAATMHQGHLIRLARAPPAASPACVQVPGRAQAGEAVAGRPCCEGTLWHKQTNTPLPGPWYHPAGHTAVSLVPRPQAGQVRWARSPAATPEGRPGLGGPQSV